MQLIFNYTMQEDYKKKQTKTMSFFKRKCINFNFTHIISCLPLTYDNDTIFSFLCLFCVSPSSVFVVVVVLLLVFPLCLSASTIFLSYSNLFLCYNRTQNPYRVRKVRSVSWNMTNSLKYWITNIHSLFKPLTVELCERVCVRVNVFKHLIN